MAHLRPSSVLHYLFSRAPDELSSPHVVSRPYPIIEVKRSVGESSVGELAKRAISAHCEKARC